MFGFFKAVLGRRAFVARVGLGLRMRARPGVLFGARGEDEASTGVE